MTDAENFSAEAEDRATKTEDFRVIVDTWVESKFSQLWKYFGRLGCGELSERESWSSLAIWTSMLQRRLGTPQFRMVVGAEQGANRTKAFHTLIGGVRFQNRFELIWLSRWQDLGGSGGMLQEFEPCFLRDYLQILPDVEFKLWTKLPIRPLS